MQRNRYKKNKASTYVARIIGEHYIELHERLCRGKHGNFGSRSYEDIFSDTIIFVIQDSEAANLITPTAVIEYFIYRYNMIEYQVIKDSQQLKETAYADYLQIKENTQEE